MRVSVRRVGVAAAVLASSAAWAAASPTTAAAGPTVDVHAYTGADVPIPDGGPIGTGDPGPWVSAPVTVSQAGAVSDVDVRIDGSDCSLSGMRSAGIDHPDVAELELRLVSPAGTVVSLAANVANAGPGDVPRDFCLTTFNDDTSADNIQDASKFDAPFTGTWRPNRRLSAFDGEDPDGQWRLQVRDCCEAFDGSIREWSLRISTRPTCASRLVTVELGDGEVPTGGPDVILGTTGRDVINSSGGRDYICAQGGNDVINSGPGVDAVFAGIGNDTVHGGVDDDVLYGQAGADRLYGDQGMDNLDGGDGNDSCTGGPGFDFAQNCQQINSVP